MRTQDHAEVILSRISLNYVWVAEACVRGRGAIPEEKALSPLTKLEKPKTTSDTKSENPLVFLPKTENRMLKQSKTANRNRHKNRKTEGNGCKNRKTDLKNGQNRKTENPNAPLLKMWIALSKSLSRG